MEGRRAWALPGDLRRLADFYAARFIVWLTLRRREKERAREHAQRRKQFKPAAGNQGVGKSR